MASRGGRNGGGGCAVLFVVLLAIAAVVYALSAVGHFLGLTPTGSEVFGRPEGWVSRHYAGVFWGYVLTIVLMAFGAAVVWLAVSAQGTDEAAAARARLLPRVGGAGLLLLVVAIALPIGPQANARGNVPNVVGMDAATAKAAIDHAKLSADFGGPEPMNDQQCRVTEQRPGGESELDEYGTVTLQCMAQVPQLVGKKAETAESSLQDAGFESRLVNEPSDYDLSRCRVRRENPTDEAAPYSTVTLSLKCKKPPPEPKITDFGGGGEPPYSGGGSPDPSEASGGSFCDTHDCIPSFDEGDGSIVQCADGEWSHSGGRPGACSSHGGEK